MTPTDRYSLEYASALDAQDELARFRAEFVDMDPRVIYLDGNSLGRLPVRAIRVLRDTLVEEWGERLVRSWSGWIGAPARIGDKIGRLLGAAPGQVIVSDSTSVNLYKLVTAALGQTPARSTVLTDALNFPSDLYVIQGAAQQAGRVVRVLPEGGASEGGASEGGAPTAAVIAAINSDTALVALSLVAFKSGCLYDAPAIVNAAHKAGALVLLDLCHAAGAVPVDLDGWGVDLAVGCTYKYLNGGPGAPAFLYVSQELVGELRSPIWGWFGDAAPFAFDLNYTPAPGVERFLAGTPPMLSLVAVEPGVDLLLEAGMGPIRAKSLAQTGYLIDLADEFLAPLGFTVATPRAPERRGSHVALRHPDGYRINRALIEQMGVIPDFREPDVIRLGVTPLYTTFEELYLAVERAARVVREGKQNRYPTGRLPVT